MVIDPDSIPHDPPRRPSRTFESRESLRPTGQEAAAYLGAALEDAVHQKDGRLFSIALSDVLEARGQKSSARHATSAGTLDLMRLGKALRTAPPLAKSAR